MYIHLVVLVDVNIGEWFIKLNKSLNRLKQESANWADLLNNCLERRGFRQYQVDPCEFYRKESVILIYGNYYVTVSHKQEKITSLI